MGELEQLLALVKQKEMKIVDNDSSLEALENKKKKFVSGFKEMLSSIQQGAVGDPQLFVLSFGCSIVLVRDLSNFYQNLNASRADMRSPVINQKQAL
ncbi:hypothetical protein JHK85_032569 [Glycine max]|nr:hypothetical protein JHK85_032569 [Glycine max]KAG4995176.1 hypothetical protein JHK86_032003 [Glycine max]